MRGLATLLRLARNRAEDHRSHLALAVDERIAAESELRRHDAAMEAEDGKAAQDAVMLKDWAAWAAAASRQRQGLAQASGVLQRAEDEARERVRESLAEAKRLEVALEASLQAARLRAQRRLQAAAEETELQRPKGWLGLIRQE